MIISSDFKRKEVLNSTVFFFYLFLWNFRLVKPILMILWWFESYFFPFQFGRGLTVAWHPWENVWSGFFAQNYFDYGYLWDQGKQWFFNFKFHLIARHKIVLHLEENSKHPTFFLPEGVNNLSEFIYHFT